MFAMSVNEILGFIPKIFSLDISFSNPYLPYITTEDILMYGSFESKQYVEVCVNKQTDEWDELEFIFDLACTAIGDPGCMYQQNGDPGWPPEAPEFEINTISFHDESGKLHYLTYEELVAEVGNDDAYEMARSATMDAIENGEF
jgi:hypothetical protein